MKAQKRTELTQNQAGKLVDYINSVGKDEVIHDLSKIAIVIQEGGEKGKEIQNGLRTVLWMINQITSPD